MWSLTENTRKRIVNTRFYKLYVTIQ